MEEKNQNIEEKKDLTQEKIECVQGGTGSQQQQQQLETPSRQP